MTPDHALETAVLACESALADYQAGLLDDTELRRALGRAGIVHTDTGCWLLDIDSRQWRRYLPVPPNLSFDARTVRRWRAGLRQLALVADSAEVGALGRGHGGAGRARRTSQPGRHSL